MSQSSFFASHDFYAAKLRLARSQMYMPVLQAKNEVKVLAALKHVNIVRYYECYAGKTYANFILLYNHEHLRMPKDVSLLVFQRSRKLMISLNTSQNAIWHSTSLWSTAKVVIWTTCCAAGRDSSCQRMRSCATSYKLLLL